MNSFLKILISRKGKLRTYSIAVARGTLHATFFPVLYVHLDVRNFDLIYHGSRQIQHIWRAFVSLDKVRTEETL